MTIRSAFARRLAVVAFIVWGFSAAAAREAGEEGRPLAEGDVVRLGGHKAVLTKLDTLPYVQSDYSKRFRSTRTTTRSSRSCASDTTSTRSSRRARTSSTGRCCCWTG